ncbi:MAG TPA: c-type cytochrome, partial [Gemmatales bacterium]|nr:c-type cytochrome [Gemmatales bacterium]
ATIPDPDPELERKTFLVDPRFEVNLFAADPMLAKPIQMNWDASGRLWIVSSEVYPQIKPGQLANNKIIILEDTNGDGKADKTTVFADGLLIPTGLLPGDGGCYVANSTELLHFSDTNGDGKADNKRIVLSGFGTEDTHHMLHTLRWGPDGRMYMMQSIYIHSHIETPHGPRRLNAGGIWRFKPETMELDVFARGWVNPWGLAFDRYGQAFVTDGAGGEGINYVIPGGYYVTAADARRIFPGLNPGSPKFCGLEVTSGRHLPDDWQGNLLTNDFRGHRVCRFILKDDGAGFAAIEQPELIKSTHPAFRPIDVKMGPDGAIYIADWYNPIIQHGEVDFRDPRRDVTHGRIWRVTAKGRPLVKKPKIEGATTAELLEALKQPEQWTKDMARKSLQGLVHKEEWNAKDELALSVKNQSGISPAELDHLLLEYAWIQENNTDTLLRSSSPEIRSAAVRFFQKTPGILDPHPRVRMEAVRQLSQVPEPGSILQALSILNKPMDRFLDYALWLTVRELEPQWVLAFREGKLKFDDPKHLLFAVQASGSPELVEPLLAYLQQNDFQGETADALWNQVAKLGGPKELQILWEQCQNSQMKSTQRLKRLEALIAAKARPAGDLQALEELANHPETTLQALQLAGKWKYTPLLSKVTETAKSDEKPMEQRLAALDALGSYAATHVLKELTHSPNRNIQLEALLRLIRLDLGAASTLTAEYLTQAKETDLNRLLSALLLTKDGPQPLTAALQETSLPADAAKVAIRIARSTGQVHQPLIDAFTKAGNLNTVKWEATPETMKQLLEAVQNEGNAARGELVYRQKELNCLKCHAIGGSGGQVGPDLTSIGASAQPDYLLESLLLPSKAIKENYNTTVVATADGKVLTGIKQRENREELILRDAEGKDISIAIKDIEERQDGKSLMPEGLVDNLTKQELVDLTRFLTELGKVGEYSIGTARVARTWEVLVPNKVSFELAHRESIAGIVTKPKGLLWAAEYTTVAGILPLQTMATTYSQKKGEWSGLDTEIGFARTRLEVGSAGNIVLQFNSSEGLLLWVGKEPVEAQSTIVLKLTPGVHVLTLAVNKKSRKEGIRLELRDAEMESGQARWLLGP